MGATANTPAARSTQQKLRAELDARGWGIRTLARVMAEKKGQPERVESLRRMLKRYLAPVGTVIPTTGSRYDIEEALGIERDSLKADDADDEEAARFMSMSVGELFTTLLGRAVESAVDARMAAREEASA